MRGFLERFADEGGVEGGIDGRGSPFLGDGLVGFLRGGGVGGGREVPPPLVDGGVVVGFLEDGVDDLVGFLSLAITGLVGRRGVRTSGE